MNKPKYGPQDYLNAIDVCDNLLKSREAKFQSHGAEMNTVQAKRHFSEREALIRVKIMLCDEGERLAGK